MVLREEKIQVRYAKTWFSGWRNKQGLHPLKIVVFYFNILWWKLYSKTSRWYVWKLLQQIMSIIVQLNSNKPEFQKQPLTKVSQNRCFYFSKFKWKHLRWSLFSIPVTLLRKDFCTCILLRILRIFQELLFYRTLPDDYFWIFDSFYCFWHPMN